MWFPFFRSIKSNVHGKISFTKINGHKALRAGGVTHSGGEIWPMWEKVLNQTKNYQVNVENCLVLGVGGGDVIKLVRRLYPKASIKGIELDPVMIDVAEKHFDISFKHNAVIEIADAIEWVQKHQNEQYDLLICDLYIGPLNPLPTRTESYLRNLYTLLSPNGILLYNAHYQEKNTLEFDVFLRSCKKIFAKVEIVFSYPLNRVLLLRKIK